MRREWERWVESRRLGREDGGGKGRDALSMTREDGWRGSSGIEQGK